MSETNWTPGMLREFGQMNASRLAQFGVASHKVEEDPARMVLTVNGAGYRFLGLIEGLPDDDVLRTLTRMPIHVTNWLHAGPGNQCDAFDEEPVLAFG